MQARSARVALVLGEAEEHRRISGPDLAKARKLVSASGTRGQRVVVWTFPLPPALAAGRLAAATLRQLGYRASLRRIADENLYFAKVQDSRTRVQAGFVAWSSDYPVASNFLTQFACDAFQRSSENNPNTSEICDRHIDHAIRSALVRQTAGFDLANTPRVSGNFWMRYNFPSGELKGLGFGTGVSYIGKVWTGDPTTTVYFQVPGWTRVDSSAYYKWKTYDLALNVQNLLDRRYIGYAQSALNLAPAEQRKLTLSATKRF